MGGAPSSLHESCLLYLPWSVHGACMDHLFLRLFGTCSTPTLICAHRPSYTSPPEPPWALDLSLGIVHIMDLLGNETARKWAVPVIGASSHTPHCRTLPITSHRPCLSRPTRPTHQIPHALPVTSHTPCQSCPMRPTHRVLRAPPSRPTCPAVAPRHHLPHILPRQPLLPHVQCGPRAA